PSVMEAAAPRSTTGRRSLLILSNMSFLWSLDEAYRLSRHRLPATDRALPLAALDLQIDTRRLHPHRLGQHDLHGAELGPQPRRLGVDDRIHVAHAATLPRHHGHDGFQQLEARDVLVARIRRRKVRAEVVFPYCAQKRVAHRVCEDIGIRVAVQPLGVGNLDAAEDQLAPGRQRVDVIAEADLHALPIRASRMASAMTRSSGAVILMFSQVPGTISTLCPNRSTRAASSVACRHSIAAFSSASRSRACRKAC